MKSNSLIVFLALSLTSACSPQPKINAQDLETEIKLARAEGFSVTIEDLRNKIPSISDEDNAANLVRELIKIKGDYSSIEESRNALNEGSEGSMAIVEHALQKNQAIIPLVLEIAKKKSLSFDRKWELGVALTFPELSTLKLGPQVLLLMAWKSADQGDHLRAVVQIKQAMDFANLINEPLIFPGIAKNAMTIQVLRTTAMLAKKYPKQNYTKALKELISQITILSTPDFIKNELALVIATYDAFKSKESAELYNKATESPFNQKLAPTEPEYSRRKAEIIHFFRQLVQIYSLPSTEIEPELKNFDIQLLQILKSNPNAQNLVASLGPIPSSWKPIPNDEQTKIVFNQVVKVLESGRISPTEETLQLKNGSHVSLITEVDGSSVRVSLIEQSSSERLFRIVIR